MTEDDIKMLEATKAVKPKRAAPGTGKPRKSRAKPKVQRGRPVSPVHGMLLRSTSVMAISGLLAEETSFPVLLPNPVADYFDGRVYQAPRKLGKGAMLARMREIAQRLQRDQKAVGQPD